MAKYSANNAVESEDPYDLDSHVYGPDIAAPAVAAPESDPYDLSSHQPDYDPYDLDAHTSDYSAPKPERTLWDETKEFLGDSVLDLGNGTIMLGDSIIGLGSLATGGLLNKGMKAIGYRPEEAQQFLSSMQSDDRQRQEMEYEAAKGWEDTAKVLITNPALLGGKVVETAPMMLGIMGAAKAFAARAYASAFTAARTGGASTAAATKVALEASTKAATVAAATAEGAMQSGSSFQQYMNEGMDMGTAYVASIGSGITTGLTAFLSGGLGKKIGLGDVEAGVGTDSGIFGRFIKGGLQEGLLEEMPQSAMEQMWDNYAHERPLMQGVEKAAATGALVGGAAGGGFGVAQGRSKSDPNKPDQTPALFVPTHTVSGKPVQQVTKRGQIVPNTYVNEDGDIVRTVGAESITGEPVDLSMDVDAVAEKFKSDIENNEALNPYNLIQSTEMPTGLVSGQMNDATQLFTDVQSEAMLEPVEPNLGEEIQYDAADDGSMSDQDASQLFMDVMGEDIQSDTTEDDLAATGTTAAESTPKRLEPAETAQENAQFFADRVKSVAADAKKVDMPDTVENADEMVSLIRDYAGKTTEEGWDLVEALDDESIKELIGPPRRWDGSAKGYGPSYAVENVGRWVETLKQYRGNRKKAMEDGTVPNDVNINVANIEDIPKAPFDPKDMLASRGPKTVALSQRKKNESPKVKAFMDEYKESTFANPLMPQSRIVMNRQLNTGGDFAMLDVRPTTDENNNDGLYLGAIQSSETGKGNGNAAMKALTDLADKHGLPITLGAKAFGTTEGMMTTPQLKKWYSKWGFSPSETSDPDTMVRPPKRLQPRDEQGRYGPIAPASVADEVAQSADSQPMGGDNFVLKGAKGNGSDFKMEGLTLKRGEIGSGDELVFSKGTGENRQSYTLSPNGLLTVITAKSPKPRKVAVGAFVDKADSQTEAPFNPDDMLARREDPINPVPDAPKDGPVAPVPDQSDPRMVRAKKDGYNTEAVYYHSTKQDVTELKPRFDDGLVFLTSNPKFAGRWAARIPANDQDVLGYRQTGESGYPAARRESDDYRESVDHDRYIASMEADGNETGDRGAYYREVNAQRAKNSAMEANVDSSIYPVVTSVKKTFDPRTNYAEIEDFLKAMPNGMDKIVADGNHKAGNWIVYENPAVVEELKRLGYDSMLISEDASTGDKAAPHETLAVFDAKQVRSINAQFMDPSSGNMLARREDSDPYSRMRGVEYSYQVQVESTGQIHTVTADAAATMEELDARIAALEELRACI